MSRKTDQTTKARNILHAAGERRLLGDERAFVLSLLSCHPRAGEKIGAGVVDVFVRRNRAFGVPEFWVRRADGSETDFSYRKCLSASLDGDRAKFLIACRREVRDQRDAAVRAAFASRPALVCPLTGERITPDNCHVDHAPPNTFQSIVDRFFGLTMPASFPGESGVRLFVDRVLASRWKDFHARNAVLRVVSARGNLTLPRK